MTKTTSDKIQILIGMTVWFAGLAAALWFWTTGAPADNYQDAMILSVIGWLYVMSVEVGRTRRALRDHR